MTDNNSIIEKINALLNKTTENGCSVEESATAAKLAQKLLTEYKLSTSDLSVDAESVHNNAKPLVVSQRLTHWKSWIANALCQTNGCKAYTNRNKTIEVNKKGRAHWVSKCELRIIGRDSDIEIVRYFFEYLTNEIERLCKQAMAEGHGTGKTWANNFKSGATNAVTTRLKEGYQEVRNEHSNSTAIVKLDARDVEVQKWVSENLKLSKGYRSYASADYDAFYQGQRAGKSISLNKGLGSKSQKLLE